MLNKTIEELHECLINNRITSKELINESVEKCKKIQDNCNAFVTILDNTKEAKINENLLSSIPFGVKDNFSTKGILTTGSSNTLKNYIPIFSATAVKNLEDKGAIFVSKTALDEFGMGGTGTTCHTGVVLNPWDRERICGGSSSGSAASVAAGCYPFALGSDTGDSIRKPAAFCGVVGYKPTYGMISRYGLFPFASSLDTCGCLTRSVKDAAIVVDAMKGIDENDLTTWDSSNVELFKSIDGNVNNKKLFYIKELVDINNYKNPSEELIKHIENFHETLNIIQNSGCVIEEVSIDSKLLKVIPAVYTCISCAEATSNMANLTGISFGERGKGEDIFSSIKDYRTNGFSPLIKRRFVIGEFVLQKENQEKYLRNAQRVRRLIVDTINSYFEKYDGLILPVSSGPAPKIDEINERINSDEISALESHLDIGNFGGFPSITIPNGFINNMPVGINITSKRYDDANLLNIAYALESLMPYKNQIARGDHNE